MFPTAYSAIRAPSIQWNRRHASAVRKKNSRGSNQPTTTLDRLCLPLYEIIIRILPRLLDPRESHFAQPRHDLLGL